MPSGNVLVGTRVGVGKAAANLIDIAISQDLTAAIVSPDRVYAAFLTYALASSQVQEWFRACERGATIKGIARDDLAHLELLVPPLPEQRAIAHVLDTVQRAKEASEAVVAALRELKRSLMQHLFTYGPVPVQEADRVALRETPYGPLADEWAVVPLSECATVQTGVTKGRRVSVDEAVSVPYLRVANVQSGYLDLSEVKCITLARREMGRYLLRPGDVLLTEGGDFDKLGRGFIWHGEVPVCVHQNHVFAVRTDRSVLVPEYLAYLTQSQYGRAYFLEVAHRTTNLASINSTKLKAFPVPVPPLGLQEEVASMLAAVDGGLRQEEARCSALGALSGSLLHSLMTGQVRVTPDDVLPHQEVV